MKPPQAQAWDVTFDYPGSPEEADITRPDHIYRVVERIDSRTVGVVARDRTRQEAHAIANAREAVEALQNLWDAIHREDHEDYFDSELVGDELKAAFDVLMRAKGVRTR